YLSKRFNRTNEAVRRRRFRPWLEQLEGRMHPGSLLMGGLNFLALAPIPGLSGWSLDGAGVAEPWTVATLEPAPAWKAVGLDLGIRGNSPEDPKGAGQEEAAVSEGTPSGGSVSTPAQEVGLGSDRPVPLPGNHPLPTVGGLTASTRGNLVRQV